MENFRSSISTAKYTKIAVEFAFSAKTTATLPRARYIQACP